MPGGSRPCRAGLRLFRGLGAWLSWCLLDSSTSISVHFCLARRAERGKSAPQGCRPRISKPLHDILLSLIFRAGRVRMASSAVTYAQQNQQRFLGELKDLLRIPSVSTAPEHKDD